jgi:hypothetical protein
LRCVFSAEILSFLRRAAYQVFFIRTSRAALRACPQAEASLFRIDFRKIHGRSIKETSDFGHHVHPLHISVLAKDEVSARGAVVDETIRLAAGIGDRSSSVTLAVQEARIEPHFQKMFVTKRASALARLVSRHIPSFSTTPSALQAQTACQRNTPVPSGFERGPQYVNSYAAGFQMSREGTEIGRVRSAGGELCFLSNGKGKVRKERRIGGLQLVGFRAR